MGIPVSYKLSYRRFRRGLRVFRKSLADAKGLNCKWAMCRCIVGHTRARLGWPGQPQEVTIRPANLRITVDICRAEIVPFWEMWYEDAYEQLPQFRPEEDWCVVDVGGNIGFYAIRQAIRLRRGRVVVFEPSPAAFRRLLQNVNDNMLTNVTVVNAAVGSSSGMVHLIQKARTVNCRVVAKKTDDTIDVPCTTLDAELVRLGIDHVDILKIDTEGAERAVLSGATGILHRVSQIVLELHNNADEERCLIDEMLRPAGLHRIGQYDTLVYYIR